MCSQSPVPPGHEAQPFLDFRATIRELPPAQQVRVVGAGALKLVERGRLRWEDVVTRTRVRSLSDLVGKFKLSVKDMEAAGIPSSIARRAWRVVNSPAELAAEAARRDLLRAAVATQGRGGVAGVVTPTARELARRLGIRGPSGGFGAAAGAKPAPPSPWGGQSSAPTRTIASVEPMVARSVGRYLGANLAGAPVSFAGPEGIARFAEATIAAANRVGPEGRQGAGKAFISHVYAEFGRAPGVGDTDLDLDEFKRLLVRANRDRHLDLARADLVEAMHAATVRASHTHSMTGAGYSPGADIGASFHFVRLEPPPKSRPRPRPPANP